MSYLSLLLDLPFRKSVLFLGIQTRKFLVVDSYWVPFVDLLYLDPDRIRSNVTYVNFFVVFHFYLDRQLSE
jgi:hypothetical protein